jgi:hypothetical protein
MNIDIIGEECDEKSASVTTTVEVRQAGMPVLPK